MKTVNVEHVLQKHRLHAVVEHDKWSIKQFIRI